MGDILNEFLRNGTNSKDKAIKEKSWQFLHIALETHNKKMSDKICNCLEKGIEQCLKNKMRDKLIQEHCFKILYFLQNKDEKSRVLFDKLYTKSMSADAQKTYEKVYGKKGRNSMKQQVQLNVMKNREKRVSVG